MTELIIDWSKLPIAILNFSILYTVVLLLIIFLDWVRKR